MKLLDFFNRESEVPKKKLIFTALTSGLANGYLLIIINNAAETINGGADLQLQHFLIFLLDLILLAYTKQYTLKNATMAAEDAIDRVRTRVADKLRHTELHYIETVGHTSIYTRIAQDTSLISESAIMLANACQQIIVVAMCLLYIAWLSIPGFLLTISILCIAILMYFYNSSFIKAKLREASEKETSFFNGIRSILLGFKEIKINHKKNEALFSHIKNISNDVKDIKVSAGFHFVIDLMFAQTAFFILCAGIIFALPAVSVINVKEVVGITIAILFLFAPLAVVINAFSMFVRANIAVENIYELEQEIDAVSKKEAVVEIDVPTFESLEFDKLTFHYPMQDGSSNFGVGPLSFKIKKGDVLFIVGGNGSGKSTLLKLLTGLYYPISGNIYLNDKLLSQKDYLNFRELYTTIFTDFHLFENLYGIDNIDENRVDTLLKEMELDKKTSFEHDHFSNTDLSTGQRKRLAYIASLLEDKQIFIFDEWAADQDPEFRKHFYEVLLGELKAKGKTAIAVSHDDRYFSAADTVIKMEYGQITATQTFKH